MYNVYSKFTITIYINYRHHKLWRNKQLDIEKIEQLKTKAIELRQVVLSVVYKVQYGNIASSLALSDLVTAIYFNFMNIDSKKPNWDERDRFILSRKNVIPLQYSALYLLGFLDRTNLYSLGDMKSVVQTSPDMNKFNGIDISSTGYGQGLSQGVGMALAFKRDKKFNKVFVILGDNECNEGQIWEASSSASKYKLDNLIVIVDNSMLSDTPHDDITQNNNLREKFKAFGFETQHIDGNDMSEIITSLAFVSTQKNGKPKCLICDTVKGKGVSFMENVPSWNDTTPTKEQFERAMLELGGVK